MLVGEKQPEFLGRFSYRCIFGNFTGELYVGSNWMVKGGFPLAKTPIKRKT